MSEDTRADLRAAIADEEQAIATYGALAQRLHGDDREAVLEIGRDESGHARELELILAHQGAGAMDRRSLVITKGDEMVGVVGVGAEHEQDVRRGLESAGYGIGEPVAVEGESIVLEEHCEADKPRPCEIRSALLVAEALAGEGGTEAVGVAEILQRGHCTEDEAKAAVQAAVNGLPEDMRQQGNALLDEAFRRG